MAEIELLTQLRQLLTKRFSDGELRTFCFDLGVGYDDLPGSGKADKAREIVDYMERYERLADLVRLGRVSRPDVSWPTFDIASQAPITVPIAEGASWVQGAMIGWTRVNTMLQRPADSRSIELYASHCPEDTAKAQAIIETLAHAGLVCASGERLKAGLYRGIESEQAIRRASAVVVLITQAARESGWLRNEIRFALEVKRPIIPLMLQPGILPMIEICGLQSIRLYEDRAAGISELVRRARELAPYPVPEDQPLAPAFSSVRPARVTVRAPASADPFFCGSAIPVDLFAGRALALQVIGDRLWGYNGLQSLSIVANRRMGKSSLLNYIAAKHQELFPASVPYVVVFIDAMDVRAHTTAGFMRILRLEIKRQLNQDLWPEKKDGNLFAFSEALANLQHIRLVLLLDEWESVMAYRNLDPLLQQLRVSGSQSQIGMITATAHPLSDLEKTGKLVSRFGNIFYPMHYLGNLTHPEWEELVRVAFDRGSQAAETQDYALIGELAGGHPFLTQLAGSLIWQARRDRRSSADIRASYRLQAQPVFDGILELLNLDQLQSLKRALGWPVEGPVPQHATYELQCRGVLTEALEPFCNPFADYVREALR